MRVHTTRHRVVQQFRCDGRVSDNSLMCRSAPEVLEQGYFSSASDVWSFGVVVWEVNLILSRNSLVKILTYAKLPFNWLSNREVAEVVPKGERLPQPSNCPGILCRWDFVTRRLTVAVYYFLLAFRT